MNVAGEEGDASPETIDSWTERVKGLLTKGYMNERRCFWKAMPPEWLSQKESYYQSNRA